MSFFKKIGKGLKKIVKKVAPFAPLAAAFIPGVGSALSAGASAIGGMFSAKDGAQSFPVRSEGDPPQQSPGFLDQASSFLKSATPALVGGMNYYGQMQTNAANAQQAQKQMDFQNEQTSSAYQRGTADMKAAGLNPMLAYSQGGASSGGGAMAQMGNELGQGANSALSSAMSMQQLKGMEIQNEQQRAEIRRTNADTDYIDARRADTLAGIATHADYRGNLRAGTSNLSSKTKGQDISNEFDAESFKDRLKQISSAVAATNSSAELNRARVGEAAARSKVTGGFGDWIGKGVDNVNSATDAIGHWIGQNAPTPYDIGQWYDKAKSYGKR